MHTKNFSPVARTLFALSIAVSAGCSDDTVNLGDSKPDGRDVQNVGASLIDYSGSWEGYAEAYKFNDDSDRVRLTIGADGVGYVVVGDAAAPPTPEADKRYPPPPPGWMPQLERPEEQYSFGRLLSGFHYSVVGASVANKRIQFHLSEGELYEEWCSLRTPIAVEQSMTSISADGGVSVTVASVGYFCGPQAYRCDHTGCYSQSETLENIRVDDAQLTCADHCDCDANSCGASASSNPTDLFDAALEQDGDKLVGTLVLLQDRVTVRLTRVAPECSALRTS